MMITQKMIWSAATEIPMCCGSEFGGRNRLMLKATEDFMKNRIINAIAFADEKKGHALAKAPN